MVVELPLGKLQHSLLLGMSSLSNPWDSRAPLVMKGTRQWLFAFNKNSQPSSIVG
ncbi:hypothetical protein Gogos_014500 [Gossypium gossypioides]|uniref:Uncharacterized protein n=1 Tax=Gossypium gossypioides TaxID=34282 RepID=A0A7J9BYX2_GOSGO|nr:hypothetical protein [Gossypium gossypioides]